MGFSVSETKMRYPAAPPAPGNSTESRGSAAEWVFAILVYLILAALFMRDRVRVVEKRLDAIEALTSPAALEPAQNYGPASAPEPVANQIK